MPALDTHHTSSYQEALILGEKLLGSAWSVHRAASLCSSSSTMRKPGLKTAERADGVDDAVAPVVS
eukprot:scaffold166462_cov30-Tisochrysis_lutea.AAC.2